MNQEIVIKGKDKLEFIITRRLKMFSEDNYGGNSISAFLDDYSFVDMIIKIGVLKVRDNKFVETFGTLINSRCVMFDFITQLTGINKCSDFSEWTHL